MNDTLNIIDALRLPILNTNAFSSKDTAKSVQSLNTIDFGYTGNTGSLYSFSGVPSYLQSPSQNSTKIKEYYKSLLEDGTITDDDYDKLIEKNRNQTRRSLGLPSEEDDLKSSVSSLDDDDLEKAKNSNKGIYEVNEAQTAMAKNAVARIKEILKKDPSDVSEAEAQDIQNCFSALKENPMLADAFITKANKTTFKGENSATTTLLGSYQQVLSKLHGKKEAEDQIKEIKTDLEETVGKRNSTAFTTFSNKYDSDKENIKGYGLIDKAKRNPLPAAFLGLTAAGALTGTIALGCKFKTLGKFGLLAAGVIGLGAATVASVKALSQD